MIGWAYQSGRYLPLEEVRLPVHDAGFAMGVTATDQCRTYSGKLFRLPDHLDRFQRSCAICKLQLRLQPAELSKIINEVLQRSQQSEPEVPEWSVVWLMTGGVVGNYLGLPGGILQAEPELIVYAFPFSDVRFQHFYERGAVVRIARSITSPGGPWTSAKQRSRLHWWLAEQEVKNIHPEGQALLLDREGFVTETSIANIILVQNGRLRTPRSSRVLAGVTLQVVKELCSQLQLQWEEADLREDDILSAEELLLTSTPFGIAPVGNIDGRKLPVNGPVFSKLWLAWQQLTIAHAAQPSQFS